MDLYDRPDQLLMNRIVKPLARHSARKVKTLVTIGAVVGTVYFGTQLISHGADNLFNGIQIRNNIPMQSIYVGAGVGLSYIPKIAKGIFRGGLKAKEMAIAAVGVVGSGATYGYLLPGVSSWVNACLTAPDPLQHQIRLTNPEMGAAILTMGLVAGAIWQGVTDIRSYTNVNKDKEEKLKSKSAT